MYFFVLFVYLLPAIRAQQYPCSCSCCNTYMCTPTTQPITYVSTCTSEVCAAQCRAIYPQCQGTYPNTQVIAQCGTSYIQLYNCRCECCSTGSATCTPSYIGTSVAYTCQPGACSISCSRQYPSQCISNENGQTQGTCTGLITTTSTTTTIGPWLGNTCSCMCCQTGSYCTTTNVGITSASQCSTTACTQACQIRYPSVCPSIYSLGQTSGTCTSGSNSGNTRCACRCCGSDGCLNYDIRTNEVCTTCNSLCQSQTQCRNSYQVTYTCYLNDAKRLHSKFIFILILTFFSLF
ncbi:hypothetical protein I4U23_019797 [Adineta vaga]|nr:hypothetical protein I4U23_019797 [Adineta vaga]